MDLTTALLMGAGTVKVPVLGNYVTPGLNSYLIRELPNGGKIRLFHMTRRQITTVTPHSHRFNLTSHVLAGKVSNTLWRLENNSEADLFSVHEQVYKGSPGEYEISLKASQIFFAPETTAFETGQSYRMASHEIHSIVFEKGALVLIHEGPEETDTSHFLEPFDGDQTIPLMKPTSWMFKPVGGL